MPVPPVRASAPARPRSLSFPPRSVEGVRRAVSGEDVRAVRSRDALHGREQVGVPGARPRAGGQVDVDAGRSRGVVGGVGARAAVQDVAAGRRRQRVVARPSGEDVRARAAGQRVPTRATGHVLHGSEGVHSGADGVLRAGEREIDRDRERRRAVVGGVGSPAAVEAVRADGAGEGVGKRGADDALRGQDGVRSGAARVLRGQAREVEGDAGVGGRVVERVRPRPALQRVVPAEARERVVTVVADERVGARLARDRVVAGAAGDVGDRVQRVGAGRGRGCGAGARAAQRTEDGGDSLGERGVVDGVSAEIAVERVVPGIALEDVVAGAAGEDVHARVAGEDVGAAAAGQVLEAGDGVRPGSTRRLGRAVGQAQRHAARDARVVERVRVGAGVENVVSGALENRVVAVVAEDHVAPGPARKPISGRSAVQGVVACPAVENVVARAAGQVVRAPAADHDVVACAADRVLDVGADVVRLAGLAVVEDAVHGHGDSRRPGAVGHEIVAAAPGQGVGAVGGGLFVEDVVPEPAGERVATVSTREHVVSGAAGDRVVPAASGEDVAAAVAGNRVVAVAARDGVAAAVAVHRQDENRGRPGHRIAAAREDVVASATAHGPELDVGQRDVDVVVGVQIEAAGAEHDGVGGRASDHGDSILYPGREIDDELDLRRARSFDRDPRGELAPAQVDGHILGAR